MLPVEEFNLKFNTKTCGRISKRIRVLCERQFLSDRKLDREHFVRIFRCFCRLPSRCFMPSSAKRRRSPINLGTCWAETLSDSPGALERATGTQPMRQSEFDVFIKHKKSARTSVSGSFRPESLMEISLECTDVLSWKVSVMSMWSHWDHTSCPSVEATRKRCIFLTNYSSCWQTIYFNFLFLICKSKLHHGMSSSYINKLKGWIHKKYTRAGLNGNLRKPVVGWGKSRRCPQSVIRLFTLCILLTDEEACRLDFWDPWDDRLLHRCRRAEPHANPDLCVDIAELTRASEMNSKGS